MIIKEAAEYLSQVTNQEVYPGQILDQLKIKFPGEKWTINSEIPETFIEQIENLANKTQKTAGAIEKAAPSTITEAITDGEGSYLNIQNCIWEALQMEHKSFAIEQAVSDSLEILNLYDETQQQVLGHLLESRLTALQKQAVATRLKNQERLIEQSKERGNKLGESVRNLQASKTRLQDSQNLLASILGI